MFNLITDLIVIKVNEAVSPETCAVFRPSKSISITLTKEMQTVEFNFTSSLIISKDGNPMDPEYPCGEISFIFYVDLLKNTFGFSTFQLSYNIDNCGPTANAANTNNPEEDTSNKINVNWKYALPAAIGTAGVIAAPFLIAALGGKRKRKIRKTVKKRKNKY